MSLPFYHAQNALKGLYNWQRKSKLWMIPVLALNVKQHLQNKWWWVEWSYIVVQKIWQWIPLQCRSVSTVCFCVAEALHVKGYPPCKDRVFFSRESASTETVWNTMIQHLIRLKTLFLGQRAAGSRRSGGANGCHGWWWIQPPRRMPASTRIMTCLGSGIPTIYIYI